VIITMNSSHISPQSRPSYKVTLTQSCHGYDNSQCKENMGTVSVKIKVIVSEFMLEEVSQWSIYHRHNHVINITVIMILMKMKTSV